VTGRRPVVEADGGSQRYRGPAGFGATVRGAGSEHAAPSSTRAPRRQDTGEPTTLLLVRHGRTPLTEAKRFSGSGGEDPGLSEAGRQDAARAAALLGRLATGDSAAPADVGRPAVLLCSPMRRTRQTAGVIAEATGLSPVVDERWIEAGFGEWEGLTFAEIIKGWPVQVARWQGSMSQAPPGGECLQDVVDRVRAARRDVVERNPGRVVVVVSHVTPVRAVLHEALAAGPAALWSVRIGPCSVTPVRFWRDGNAEVLGVNLTP